MERRRVSLRAFIIVTSSVGKEKKRKGKQEKQTGSGGSE
jgi:hypothetical protein